MATAVLPRPMSSGSRALAPLPGSALSPGLSDISSSATSPTTSQSLTAKQWVIPPRPKPGRKPATDTPPTKRKAQNRAAQRAFRERRAAKVGELEEQMDEMEREHDSIVDGLKSELETLQQSFDSRLNERLSSHDNQVRLLQAEIGGWRAHCIQLEDQVKSEKKLRLAIESELAVLKGQAVRLPRRVEKHYDQHEDSNHATTAEEAYHTPDETVLGCSNCSLDHCQCLDGPTESQGAEESAAQPKRSGSPSIIDFTSSKRLRRNDFDRSSPVPDFTDVALEVAPNTTSPARLAESCGFCQDGSTCPCAELAAEQERNAESAGSRLPSPPREMRPKPPAIKTSGLASSSIPSGCPNNPGTCTQCQNNPSSKRFCQTLAASRTASSVAPQSVPSPANLLSSSTANHIQPSQPAATASNLPINTIVPCAAGQACCRISSALSSAAHHPHAKSTSTANANATASELDFTTPAPHLKTSINNASSVYATSQAVTGPTLSCADAFSTLAKHPAFETASRDYGEWLPQLATLPGNRGGAVRAEGGSGVGTPVSAGAVDNDGSLDGGNGSGNGVGAGVPARTAFDIEAASVMGVLRFFDRRFGRDM